MVRMLINLDAEDKAWLHRAAKREAVPMVNLLRRAIRRLRDDEATDPKGFERLLRETSGLWKAGDGLACQRRLRSEWKRRG